MSDLMQRMTHNNLAEVHLTPLQKVTEDVDKKPMMEVTHIFLLLHILQSVQPLTILFQQLWDLLHIVEPSCGLIMYHTSILGNHTFHPHLLFHIHPLQILNFGICCYLYLLAQHLLNYL